MWGPLELSEAGRGRRVAVSARREEERVTVFLPGCVMFDWVIFKGRMNSVQTFNYLVGRRCSAGRLFLKKE